MQRTAPPLPTPPLAAMNKQHPHQPTYIAMLPQQPDQPPPILLVTHPYIPPPPPYPILQRPAAVPTLPQSAPIRLSQLAKPPSPPFTADQIVAWAAHHAKYGCTLAACPRNRQTHPPRSTHTSTSVQHASPTAQPEASPFERTNTHALLDDILHLIRTEEQADSCPSSASQTAMSNQLATLSEQVEQQRHEEDTKSETSASHGRHVDAQVCYSQQHDSAQFRVHGHEHICHALLDEAFTTQADEDVIQRIFSTASIDATNVTPPNT